ncbi:MAG: PLP-dependent aminotransferase family protein [Chloroflexi bacterium]|nr:PLP-dependent aminotransferase family protein [Chloroflexota bacterium]
MATEWERRYAHRTQRMGSSAIRELLKLTEQPDFISFAGGLPAPEVFPVKQVTEAVDTLMKEAPTQALQYSATEGYRPLRELLARKMSQTGVPVGLDNLMITSGSQQALDLIGKLFIDPGDRVVVEAPTYLGALQAWNAYEADYVQVAADENGMVVDELAKALSVKPKLIYLVPNFHNPSGVTLSLERRKRLVEIADQAGVPVVEDDPYGQLRFEGESLPSLLTLDALNHPSTDGYNGNVIYLSTFSKILAPGLRLAWAVAPAPVMRKLVAAKQGVDLQTSTFTQMLAYEVAREGYLDQHIEIIRATYRERRDAMLAALQESMPAGVRWNHPQGGMFLWCILPEGMNATRLLERCVKTRVAFVPGNSFYPCGGGDAERTMRLNFSNAKPEMIRAGIARLGAAIREMMAAYPLPALPR